MNNFYNWIKNNTRLVMIIMILIILSAAVGFTIGTIKRRAYRKDISFSDMEIDSLTSSALSDNQKPPFLMPEPVVPHIGDQFLKNLFYFDQNDSDLEKLKMIPVRISELLKYRDIGITSDIKPFQFHNEELDIITKKEELAEP